MNSEKFYKKAWENTKHPEELKKACERICDTYGISGVCDPAYIGNVIAKELGFGDGENNFTELKV